MIGKFRQFWSKPSVSSAGEQLSSHLMRLFKQMQINCVLDVGASRGQFGQLLRTAGYTGHIISLEPSPPDYSILDQNAQSDPRWQTRQLALGEENGQLPLNIFNDTVFNSFMEPNEYILALGCKVERTKQVDVARLDDIYDELMTAVPAPRLFLKLDTQGYDQTILRGAKETVQRILA